MTELPRPPEREPKDRDKIIIKIQTVATPNKLSETLKNNHSEGTNNIENTTGAQIDKLEELNGLKLWFLKTR